MRRGSTGHYKITSVGGEQVQAFIPHPLPPDPPVALSNARQRFARSGRHLALTLTTAGHSITQSCCEEFLLLYDRYLAILNEGTELL